ncbi:MAG: L,D-transpeptidase family protein [Pedobacter sp.]|nr:L,D-transpeptidase family protein [Pedobacter sp.]
MIPSIHRLARLLGLCFFLLLAAAAQAETEQAQSQVIADVIRARLESHLDSKSALRVANTSVPQAVVQFYAERDWQPVWDETRFQALLTQLAELYTDGLTPDDYSFSLLERSQKITDPGLLAERDMVATRAYLLALVHLYKGKVDPVRLDSHWNFDSRQLDPITGLNFARDAASKNELENVFNQARPDLPQYNAMRTALARLRSIALAGGWPELPAGPVLKPGMSDARLPLLRQRLQIAGLLPYTVPAEPDIYDDELKAAVQRFQQESYLDADGVIGPGTRNELNVPVSTRIDQIRANLERARWFMHEIKDDFVIVDLAGYRIAYVHGNEVKWRSRVQIGKEYRSTPVFKSVITYITLSPGWVVPPTIFREDALPAIRRNRDYLTRNRMSVYNAAGQKISPGSVNWNKPGNITLRQDPGPGGALGEVVIRFVNPYSVYLHDTPHKGMFNASQRATSSGCIRVENIHELAELLLDDDKKWNREAMQKVIDERKTRNVTLKKKIPILLAYWTVDMGEDGYVSFKPDVYKRDPQVVKALSEQP